MRGRALKSAHFDSARLDVVRPGISRLPRYGQNAFLGITVGAIGCGAVGFVIGLFNAGLVPGFVGWVPGGWFVPFMIALGSACTGAVAGLLMSQSASRQGSLHFDDEVSAGRTLVSVDSETEQIDAARRILLEQGAFEAAPIDSPWPKAS